MPHRAMGSAFGEMVGQLCAVLQPHDTQHIADANEGPIQIGVFGCTMKARAMLDFNADQRGAVVTE